MNILGISAFYHDSAAALIRDGTILAAAQEERFTREKHTADIPLNAVAYCLKEAGITLDDIAYVALYDKPMLTFNRLIETYLAFAPRGFSSFRKSIPQWIKRKALQHSLVVNALNGLGIGEAKEGNLVFSLHHHSHAASAFFPSPFEEAAILVMDGVGEWATTSIGYGHGRRINLLNEIRFPHSLGLLYSAFTYYLGFKVNDGEYKIMGLAPLGEPKYVSLIRDCLIDIRDDGSFRLNLKYFDYCTGLTMTNEHFAELFGGDAPRKDEPLSQRHMDLARSVQAVTEDVVLKLARQAYKKTGSKNLCLAGGVALNCVANARLRTETPFDRIWVQPASGDAGGAIGAALAVSNLTDTTPLHCKQHDGMAGTYLGPSFTQTETKEILDCVGAKYHCYTDQDLFDAVSDQLIAGKVVGWFQGRMEFGPRALGNRSILADPRDPKMLSILNARIKYREGFRPFAPAVIAEDASAYFITEHDTPYMTFVAPIREDRRVTAEPSDITPLGMGRLNQKRSDIPAVTHVDYSARIQTVNIQTNPRFYALLSAFKEKTGYSVLINTSFNVRDEPIVCDPADAYRCFMGTEMDTLVIGNIVLYKNEQW